MEDMDSCTYMSEMLLNDGEKLIRNRIVNYVYMFAISCESAVDTDIFWNRMEELTESMKREHEGEFDRNYTEAVESGIRNLKEKVEDWIGLVRLSPRVMFAWVEHLARLLAMDMWSAFPNLDYWFDGIGECDPDMIFDL